LAGFGLCGGCVEHGRHWSTKREQKQEKFPNCLVDKAEGNEYSDTA
jgi:hypothetical protein